MFEASNTPYVTIDLDQADQNMRRTISALGEAGISYRPQVRTHRSLYFAQRQLSFGAQGITATKLAEAEVMAAGGIDDIFIAHPVIGGAKLRRLGDLMRMAKITTLVNSISCASGLSLLGQRIGVRIPVLIDLDGGLNLGGAQPLKPARGFAAALRSLGGIEPIGLLYSGAPLLPDAGPDELVMQAEAARAALLETAALLRQDGHAMNMLSVSSPYFARFPRALAGIREAIEGDSLFGDRRYVQRGRMIREMDCALRVHATVVALPSESHAVLDVGSKTLSAAEYEHVPGYGHVVGRFDWSIPQLHEEHALLKSVVPHRLNIGDRLQIVPNACAATVNLQNILIGMRGGKPERLIQVDARGKDQ